MLRLLPNAEYGILALHAVAGHAAPAQRAGASAAHHDQSRCITAQQDAGDEGNEGDEYTNPPSPWPGWSTPSTTPSPSSFGNEGNEGNEGDEGDEGNEGSEGDEGNEGNEGDEGSEGNEGNEGDEGNEGNEGVEGDYAPAPSPAAPPAIAPHAGPSGAVRPRGVFSRTDDDSNDGSRSGVIIGAAVGVPVALIALCCLCCVGGLLAWHRTQRGSGSSSGSGASGKSSDAGRALASVTVVPQPVPVHAGMGSVNTANPSYAGSSFDNGSLPPPPTSPPPGPYGQQPPAPPGPPPLPPWQQAAPAPQDQPPLPPPPNFGAPPSVAPSSANAPRSHAASEQDDCMVLPQPPAAAGAQPHQVGSALAGTNSSGEQSIGAKTSGTASQPRQVPAEASLGAASANTTLHSTPSHDAKTALATAGSGAQAVRGTHVKARSLLTTTLFEDGKTMLPQTLVQPDRGSQLVTALENMAQASPPALLAGKYMLLDERAAGSQAVVAFARGGDGGFFQYAIKCALIADPDV